MEETADPLITWQDAEARPREGLRGGSTRERVRTS
jgi:hypothetical protein